MKKEREIKKKYFYSIILIGIFGFYLSPIICQAEELYAPNEIIVKFKDSKKEISKKLNKIEELNIKRNEISLNLNNLMKSENLIIKDKIISNNLVLLKNNNDEPITNFLERLKNNPNIESAELNYYYPPAIINTNDTYKDYIWGLDNTGQLVNGTTGVLDADIDAPEAWAINEGTTSIEPIIVAVIDSGVAYNHPDLSTNMWDGTNCKDENGIFLGGCVHGYNFFGNNNIPLPDGEAHGTHVSGIIAAKKNNGMGIIGVAPNSKIMALRTDFYLFSIIKAIDFATQNGAKVINASFGNTNANNFFQAEAIRRFNDAGGIFIAAAGNYTDNNDLDPFYPASYNIDNIISVAATGQSDNIASFSNWGPTSVDVGAPGVNILSPACSSNCSSDSSYQYWNGTSMATPMVVGLAALIWGTDPSISSLGVKNIILSTGDAISSLNNKTLTGKRINAFNALTALTSLSNYIPIGGYDTDNIIPSSQIDYSSETGNIAINFKMKDIFSGLSERLVDFSYSIDDGITWQEPINGDNSVAFSNYWNSNDYVSSLNYSGNSYSFTFDSKNSDSLGINSYNGDNAKIRFKIFNGVNKSLYVESESFSVSNFIQNLNITQPNETIEISASSYEIKGETNEGSLIEVFKNDVLVRSLQLGEGENNFTINVNLDFDSINNFVIKATEPIYGLEKTVNVPQITEIGDTEMSIEFDNIENITEPPYVIKIKTPSIVIQGEENMLCLFDSVDVSYSEMNQNNTCTTNGSQATCILPDQSPDGEKNIYISCKDSADNESSSLDNVNVNFTLSTKRSSGGGGGGGKSTPTIPNTTPVTCQTGQLFSPETGKKCTTYTNNTTPTSSTEVTLPITRTLKQGMKGNDVKTLQIYLNAHGYIISLSGPGSINNETTYFGLKTKNAVIQFQKNNNLIPDGVVGQITFQKML